MLNGKKLMCLTFLPMFLSPNTLTTPPSTAWQLIEKQVDNKVVQVDKWGMIKHPFLIQFEKDKELKDKIKQQFDKEKLEEQKKNQPEWQEFILTFYSSMNSENGYGAITSQGKRLSRGGVANNIIPQNTKIHLDGWGEVVVNDKGSNKHFSVDNRLDVFIERESGESDREYARRIEKLGVQKVKGYIVK